MHLSLKQPRLYGWRFSVLIFHMTAFLGLIIPSAADYHINHNPWDVILLRLCPDTVKAIRKVFIFMRHPPVFGHL